MKRETRRLPRIPVRPLVRVSVDPEYERRPPFERRLARAAQRHMKRVAQGVIWALLGALGYLLRERRPLSPLRPGDPSVRRILVVRTDLLGDTVLLTPAVRALRRGYPDAQIDVLVAPSTAGILAGDPDIARVLTFDPYTLLSPEKWGKSPTWRDFARSLRRMRQPRYDLALSVAGDINSIVTRLSGAKRRVGYAGEAYPHFMTDPVPGRRYLVVQHETRYVLDLAAAAGGIVAPADAEPRLTVLPEERAKMAALLLRERARLGALGPLIALHPGARNGRAKRWPLRHFASLADRLVDDMDALVVLTGSPNEAPLAETILRRVRGAILDLTGRTSLPELAALLAESDVVVTGDSGPMHIACAVGTPVVALHGPTDPRLSGPAAPDAIILRHDLWCSPCYDASATAECRFGNPVCMKELAPGMVFAATHRQLVRHGYVPTENERIAASRP